jgi:hypothetical protein
MVLGQEIGLGRNRCRSSHILMGGCSEHRFLRFAAEPMHTQRPLQSDDPPLIGCSSASDRITVIGIQIIRCCQLSSTSQVSVAMKPATTTCPTMKIAR